MLESPLTSVFKHDSKYTVEKWKEKTRAELIKPCHSHDGWRLWKFVVDFGRACCTHDFFFDYVVLTENWEWVLSLDYTKSTFIRNDGFILSSQPQKKSWVQLVHPKSTTNFIMGVAFIEMVLKAFFHSNDKLKILLA